MASLGLQLGGRYKNTYELLTLRALKLSPANRIYIFQCMGMIFCVEFQRYTLKFHTKYHTHTLKDMIFIQHWNFRFKSSYAFFKRPQDVGLNIFCLPQQLTENSQYLVEPHPSDFTAFLPQSVSCQYLNHATFSSGFPQLKPTDVWTRLSD